MKNPEVVRFKDGYGIRFTRKSWTVLCWVQDLFSKSMKKELTGLPLVIFDTRTSAEAEARDVVIPYLLANKDIDATEIMGW